ncbi:MAG: hypothetical protein AAGB22_08715 [Bacteroidota bacterium]
MQPEVISEVAIPNTFLNRPCAYLTSTDDTNEFVLYMLLYLDGGTTVTKHVSRDVVTPDLYVVEYVVESSAEAPAANWVYSDQTLLVQQTGGILPESVVVNVTSGQAQNSKVVVHHADADSDGKREQP